MFMLNCLDHPATMNQLRPIEVSLYNEHIGVPEPLHFRHYGCSDGREGVKEIDAAGSKMTPPLRWSFTSRRNGGNAETENTTHSPTFGLGECIFFLVWVCATFCFLSNLYFKASPYLWVRNKFSLLPISESKRICSDSHSQAMLGLCLKLNFTLTKNL